MSFADYMEPRACSFAFEALRLMVPGLSIDDFYTRGLQGDHNVKKRKDFWVKTLDDSQR